MAAATNNRTMTESLKHYATCQCMPFAWNKTRAGAATAVALGAITLVVGALALAGVLSFGSTGAIATMAVGGTLLLVGLGLILREYLKSRGSSGDKPANEALSKTDKQETTPKTQEPSESSGGCWS